MNKIEDFNPLSLPLSPEWRGMGRGVVIWNWKLEFMWDLGFAILEFMIENPLWSPGDPELGCLV
jgi:hypothetical protein